MAVYKHLLDINAGFDQVIRGLAALRNHDVFLANELDHYRALSKEARAATNSYLVGQIERDETAEAGRDLRKKISPVGPNPGVRPSTFGICRGGDWRSNG